MLVLVAEDILEWNDIIYRRVLAKLAELMKLPVQEGQVQVQVPVQEHVKEQVPEEQEKKEEEQEEVNENNLAAKEQAAKHLMEKKLRFVGFAHYRCVNTSNAYETQ